MKIEPQYVTYEQGKRLEKLRFMEKVDSYYVERDSDDVKNPNKRITSEGLTCDVKRPQHWMVIEWLRVNHGVHIKYEPTIEDRYESFVYQLGWKYIGIFETPQEATSAGIDYVLNDIL